MEKKQETRGRKKLPSGEKKVFLRVGVKAKHRKEVQRLIDNIAKQYV
jgi:hypothetical protein